MPFPAKKFNKKNFAKNVLEASIYRPVLVEFFANWCSPCVKQGPVIDKVAKIIDGSAVVGRINAEESNRLVEKYKIKSIPTFLVFRDERVVKTFVGVQEKETLLDALRNYL